MVFYKQKEQFFKVLEEQFNSIDGYGMGLHLIQSQLKELNKEYSNIRDSHRQVTRINLLESSLIEYIFDTYREDSYVKLFNKIEKEFNEIKKIKDFLDKNQNELFDQYIEYELNGNKINLFLKEGVFNSCIKNTINQDKFLNNFSNENRKIGHVELKKETFLIKNINNKKASYGLLEDIYYMKNLIVSELVINNKYLEITPFNIGKELGIIINEKAKDIGKDFKPNYRMTFMLSSSRFLSEENLLKDLNKLSNAIEELGLDKLENFNLEIDNNGEKLNISCASSKYFSIEEEDNIVWKGVPFLERESFIGNAKVLINQYLENAIDYEKALKNTNDTLEKTILAYKIISNEEFTISSLQNEALEVSLNNDDLDNSRKIVDLTSKLIENLKIFKEESLNNIKDCNLDKLYAKLNEVNDEIKQEINDVMLESYNREIDIK